MKVKHFFVWLTTRDDLGVPTLEQQTAQNMKKAMLELELHDAMRRIGVSDMILYREHGYLILGPVLTKLLNRIEDLEARNTDDPA